MYNFPPMLRNPGKQITGSIYSQYHRKAQFTHNTTEKHNLLTIPRKSTIYSKYHGKAQ